MNVGILYLQCFHFRLRLSSAVGMGRKLFRVGKPIDFIQTAVKSLSLKDDVIRCCAVGRSCFLAGILAISMFIILGWLSLDILQWLNAHGVIKLENLKWINTNAARCWLFGLLFAVVKFLIYFVFDL